MKKKYVIKTWCENTTEGKAYLEYNGYVKAKRLVGDLWLVSAIGGPLADVVVVR